MIESQPLDICQQDLYSRLSYDFAMDSQTEPFRYLNQQEHSSISDSSVSPLVDGAKKLCKCGCKNKVTNNSFNYLIGHHSRGKSYEEIYGLKKAKKLRELRSNNLKNLTRTKEWNIKLSESRKRLFKEGKLKVYNKKEFDIEQIKTLHFKEKYSIDRIAKELNCSFNTMAKFFKENNILSIKNLRHPTHCKNLSLAKKGKPNPKISEFAKKRAKRVDFHLRKYFYKKSHIPITKGKTLEEVYGKKESEKILEKMSNAMINQWLKKDSYWNSLEYKKRKSLFFKNLWKNEEYRNKTIKATLEALQKRPLKTEKLLNQILQNNFPNEWKYTGDGSFLIGYKNPDFININGKKICIEIFNPFFKIRDFGSVENYEKQRSEHFAKYGWKTIFISVPEKLDEKDVLQKITQFTNQ